MRAEFTKFGPKHNYHGAHVVLFQAEQGGRQLLGTIVDMRYDDALYYWVATVHFFNGEPWPIEPPLLALDILKRE